MGLMDRRRARLARLVAEEVTRIADADVSKASVPGLGAVPAGTHTVDATAMVQNLSQTAGGQVSPDAANALPRLDPAVPFGPGFPVYPSAINPQLRQTGRPAPRRAEIPVSWNLPGQGMPHVPWTVLRDFADNVDVARRCIEIRKTQVVDLDWSITIRPEAVESIIASTGERSTTTAAKIARIKYGDEINRLKAWFEKPDRINNLNLGEWLSMAMEEYLVIDALAIYPHLNLRSELHSLELIDGSSVKCLLDSRGAVPQSPSPAYQQLMWGFPRGEFQASDNPDEEYRTDQLIYKRRFQRTYSPYGLSPTEQCLIAGDLYLKRMEWMRQEYSAGVTPEMVITTDADFTPEQLRWYEDVFNEELAGNSEARHRARLLPRGMQPASLAQFAERYSPEYDEFIIKLIAAHYDVSPSEFGFIPARQGLGGKGLAEGQEDVGDRKKRQTVRWLCSILNDIAINWLDMPRELTFHAMGGELDDQAALAQVRDLQLKDGTRTLNDLRAEAGMPLYDFPEADMPFMVTGTGVVFLDGSSKTIGQMPGTPTEPGPPPTPTAPKAQAGAEKTDPTGPASVDIRQLPAAPPPAEEKAAVLDDTADDRALVADELRAFATFASKRAKTQKSWRAFAFKHVGAEPARLLNLYGAQGEAEAIRALSDGVLDGLTKSATMTKDEADYRQADEPEECCGTCVMYDDGACSLVEGDIEPDGVCDYWRESGEEKAAHDVSAQERDERGRFATEDGRKPARRSTKKPATKPTKKPAKPARKPGVTTSRTAPNKPVGKTLTRAQRAAHLERIREDVVTKKDLATHHMMITKQYQEAIRAANEKQATQINSVRDEQARQDAHKEFKTAMTCIAAGGLIFGVIVPVVGVPVGGAIGAVVSFAGMTVPNAAQEILGWLHKVRNEK